MKTINDSWLEFKEKTINKKASDRQLLETKRAFYAGSFCMLNKLHTIDDSITDDKVAELFVSFNKEITYFFNIESFEVHANIERALKNENR